MEDIDCELTLRQIEDKLKDIPGDFVAYQLKGRQFKVLYFTPSILKSFNISVQEFKEAVAEDALAVVMPGDREYVLNSVLGKTVGSEEIHCVFRLMHKQQGFFWVHAQSRIIGTFEGWPVVLTNYLNTSIESESFRSILEDTTTAFYSVDIHSREILYANQTAAKLARVPNPQVFAWHTCHEYFFQQKEPCRDCPLGQLELGENRSWEWFDQEKGRWFSQRIKRVRWNNHDCLEFFLNDITDRKEKENVAAQQRSAENNLVHTLASLPMMSVLYLEKEDGSLTPEVYSDEFCRFKGCTQDNIRQFNGADGYAPIHPDDREAVMETVNSCKNDQQTHSTVYRIRTRDQGYKWVGVSFTHLETGNSKYAFVIYTDIDILKNQGHQLEQEEKLRAALSAARSASAAKTEFLSRMSHDIRTPLNGIIGMTSLASENDNPPLTREYLAKVDIASKFLLGLINDILDLTKAESKKIKLQPEPYTSQEFLAYLEAVIRPLCQAKKQQLNIEPSMPETLVPVVDKLRINQIIFNLLSNAIKYTHQGGTITYRVRFTPSGPDKLQMHLEISDNGIGISEEFQKVLFEPFTQEGRSDSSPTRGSGLGLSIVKRLLDLMGGTIAVRSRVGVGTTFILDLEMGAEKASLQQSKDQARVDNQKEALSRLSGRKVLLCEDHPMNQEIAKALLMRKGMQVTLAANGKLGVEAFQKSPAFYFDVILMDIRMPVMDGYEATKVIRSLPRTDALQVPIIAMTADAFADDVQKCLDAGMNRHLAKPVNPPLLYSVLAASLQGKPDKS